MAPPIGGRGEQDVLVVQGRLLRGGQNDLVRGISPRGRAVGDIDGRVWHEVIPGPTYAIHGAAPDRGFDIGAAIEDGEQVRWTGPRGAAIEGLDHLDLTGGGTRGIERELVVEHVHDARGVGPDRATGSAEAVLADGVVCRWCDLLLDPAVATIPGRDDEQGLRTTGTAAETRVAHVHVAEERARGGVIGPHLLLVGKQGRVLLRGDDRIAPCAAIARGRSRNVVRVGHGDRLEPIERGVAGERRGQVGVIQARPVCIAEPARSGRRPERHGRVAVGHQAVLVVVRQCADGSDLRHAIRIGFADRTRASSGAQARVRRLRPACARVE